MNGGKLGDFAGKRYETVRKRTLGFQKVRTRDDRRKVKEWLKNWYPAEVEGSDCKSISEIGKGSQTWLKLGCFTFETVKYALLDKKSRIANKEPSNFTHSYIKSISFEGGILDSQTVSFSPELNTLIGIRGSGKSSVLEAIRYALDISFSEKSMDRKYKDALVEHTLGSGGKIVIRALDKFGQIYEIKRILNETPEVYVNDILQPGLSIRETVIHKPIYFGQKDLSSSGEGFEKDLVEKIIGEKLFNIRRKIEDQKQLVSEAIHQLLGLSNLDEKKHEYEQKKQDAEYKVKKFTEHGIADNLQKQTDFNTDETRIKKILQITTEYGDTLTNLVSQHEDELKNHSDYKSKQNSTFFIEFFGIYQVILDSFEKIKQELNKSKLQYDLLKAKENDFITLKKNSSEEFAHIRRKLEEELQKRDVNALNLEEFPYLQKTIATSRQMLDALNKQGMQKKHLNDELMKELSKLNKLWHQEFSLIKTELEKVNENHSSLTIDAQYKGDKEAFIQFFQNIFRGSRIRENTLQRLVDTNSDFFTMFKDWSTTKTNAGTSPDMFEKYFYDNLEALLIFQVPNKFKILYRNKELQHHSLGQRASALILFVLSQQDNDVVIIGQPEDDLDNQTIYQDVIKMIHQLKPKTQFIFATHNANFPVLGGCEIPGGRFW